MGGHMPGSKSFAPRRQHYPNADFGNFLSWYDCRFREIFLGLLLCIKTITSRCLWVNKL